MLVEIAGRWGRKPRGFANAKKRARRAVFIEAYNANPLNFLPGSIVHDIYKRGINQKAMEAVGRKILDARRHA